MPSSLPIFETLFKLFIDVSIDYDSPIKAFFNCLKKLHIRNSANGKEFPQLVVSLVEACSKTLSHLELKNCLKDISVLKSLNGSRTLRSLDVFDAFILSFSLNELHFLESLPRLMVLKKL